MITEMYMDQGSFDCPLRIDAPYDLLEQVVEFGHLVVLGSHVNPPALVSDADLLAAARYAGPVLETEWRDGGLHLRGAGMVWHLGDGTGGPVIETEKTFAAATLSTVLAGILPTAVTSGTITNTGLNTFTGVFQYEHVLEAIRTVMVDLDAHFRVNPNGSMDASKTTRNEVFEFDSPTVVVVRHGWGADPSYRGVESRLLLTRRDARSFATRLLVLDEQQDGTFVVAASKDATHSYKNMQGSALVRTAIVSKPATESITLTNYVTNELALRAVDDEQEIDTAQYELDGGLIPVGSMVHVYDPPSGFVDLTNEVRFRGETIWPKKTRIVEATWPISRGMGVYYRPSATTVTSQDWIDLTRYVEWEAGS